ncbi:hypothetical protein ALC57_10415 [Trachymyrmex cornetzi]|uniref:Uncharacterized protein n=1 Tax=Trachymyrmex cornetzi TaxID=471704 RepID=A0A195DXF2_9HYME|nr:hypothetical protein ALC57_10415 [Trachymyrmex cornetzi]
MTISNEVFDISVNHDNFNDNYNFNNINNNWILNKSDTVIPNEVKEILQLEQKFNLPIEDRHNDKIIIEFIKNTELNILKLDENDKNSIRNYTLINKEFPKVTMPAVASTADPDGIGPLPPQDDERRLAQLLSRLATGRTRSSSLQFLKRLTHIDWLGREIRKSKATGTGTTTVINVVPL